MARLEPEVKAETAVHIPDHREVPTANITPATDFSDEVLGSYA
jgi:hypothetical protein